MPPCWPGMGPAPRAATGRRVRAREHAGGTTGGGPDRKLMAPAAHQPKDTGAGLCPSPAPLIETREEALRLCRYRAALLR